MDVDALLHSLNFQFRLLFLPLIGTALLIGLPLAIFITLALIRLFRRRVGRAMRATAARAADTATEQVAPSAPALPRGELEIARMHADGKLERVASRTALLSDARQHANRLAAIYAGATCIFSFVLAGVTIVFVQKWHFAEHSPLTSAVLYGADILLFATPAVLAPTMVLKKQPRYLLLALLVLVLLSGTFDLSLSAQSDRLRMARMLAFVPLVILIAPIVLSYRPKILPIAALAFVAALWLPMAAWPIHYATGGLTQLWLFFVPAPAAIVLLLNVRRLRAVGPIIYAATAIFFLTYVFSTTLLASVEIASGEDIRFVREDLNQIPPEDAISGLVEERMKKILSLPKEEQAQAMIVFSQQFFSNFHPDTLRKWKQEMPLTVLLLGVKFLFGFVFAWLFIRWLAKDYEKRRASDQMLTIDVMMIIFVLLNFMILALNGWIAGVCALASFAAYKLYSRWGLAWLRRSTPEARPRTLLLLRVFGFDSRTQRLLEDLGQRWRYLGPIRLIGGTDLANATIEPHEFFEFLNGRLSRAFVKGPSDVEQRLSRSAITADPDGTYRVEDFFCYDDTWRMTVVRLAGDADAILMDLRGFGPANQGCLYEIEHLLSSVSLDRVVLLVDRRTDVPFLERALQQAWRSMPDDSPNALAGHPRIRILQASSRHRRTLDALLGLLCGSFVEAAPSRSPAPILQA